MTFPVNLTGVTWPLDDPAKARELNRSPPHRAAPRGDAMDFLQHVPSQARGGVRRCPIERAVGVAAYYSRPSAQRDHQSFFACGGVTMESDRQVIAEDVG